MSTALVAGAMTLGAAALVAAPAHAAPPVMIGGTVLYNGAPVSGVIVDLMQYDPTDGEWSDAYDKIATTAADGSWSYNIDGADDGQYTIFFETEQTAAVYAAPQFVDGQDWGQVDDQGATEAPTITVSGGAMTADILPSSVTLADDAGAVTTNLSDADTGLPITYTAGDGDGPTRDAYLDEGYANGESIDEPCFWYCGAETYDYSGDDLDGTVVIGGVLPGDYYEVRTSLDGYESGLYTDLPVTVTEGSTTSISMPLVSDAASKGSARTLFTGVGRVAVSGTMKVGSPVTAVNASATSASSVYQWFADDTPIKGATGATYTPTAADLGSTLSVYEYLSAPDYAYSVLSATATAPVALGDPNQESVTVGGTPQPGGTLSATVSGGTISGATNTVEWVENGNPVGDGSSYAVKPSDVGASISAVVTSIAQGHADANIASSNAVTIVAGTANQANVALVGQAKVGGVLAVEITGSTVAGTTDTVQWLSGGKTVGSGLFYTVKAGDAGQTISASVTSAATGYATATLTSNTVAVAKDKAALSAKLASKKKVTTATKPVIKVTLAGVKGVAASGTVKVTYSGKKHKSVTFAKAGTKKVTLPTLGKGKHTITLSYGGNGHYSAAKGRIKVTVVKK